MKGQYLILPLLALLAAGSPRALAAQEMARRIEVRECGRLGIALLATDPPVVDQLLPGSPAERAGIRPRDALIAVDGARMTVEQMTSLSEKLQPGRVVRLRVLRDGRTREVEAVPVRDVCVQVIQLETEPALGDADRRVTATEGQPRGTGMPHRAPDAPDAPVAARVTWRTLKSDGTWQTIQSDVVEGIRQPGGTGHSSAATAFFLAQRAVAGVEFTELNPELAAYFQGAEHGLLVLRVAPGTPGERTGLQPGDVVVAVGEEPVHGIAQLRAAIAGASREPTTISIVRRGVEKRLEYVPEE